MKTKMLWHIHVDAKELIPDDFRRFLEASRFTYTNFLQKRPFGIECQPPPLEHLTKKFLDKQEEEYGSSWLEVERAAKQSGFVGYLEGERVVDIQLSSRPKLSGTSRALFTLTKRKLKGSEQFRQDELHLVMDWERSDQRLVRAFMDAGMGVALMPKTGYTAVVLTAQGWSRDIKPLFSHLLDYCNQIGGMDNVSVKREVVRNFALFGMTTGELPEIVDQVYYL